MSATPYILAGGLVVVGGAILWRRAQETAAQPATPSRCDGAAALAGKAAGALGSVEGAAALPELVKGACKVVGSFDALRDAWFSLFDRGPTEMEKAAANMAINGARTTLPAALRALILVPSGAGDNRAGIPKGWADPTTAQTLRYANGCSPYDLPGEGPAMTCAAGTRLESRDVAAWRNSLAGAFSGRPCDRVLGLPSPDSGTDPFTRRHPTAAEWKAEIDRIRRAAPGASARGYVAFPLPIPSGSQGWWIQGRPVVCAGGVAIDHRDDQAVVTCAPRAPSDANVSGGVRCVNVLGIEFCSEVEGSGPRDRREGVTR